MIDSSAYFLIIFSKKIIFQQALWFVAFLYKIGKLRNYKLGFAYAI